MKNLTIPQDAAIREMVTSDYDNVLALWKSLPGMGLSSADERDSVAAFLGQNPSTCLVAEREGKISGTVLGGWFVSTLPGLPFLFGGLLNIGSYFLTFAYYNRNRIKGTVSSNN